MYDNDYDVDDKEDKCSSSSEIDYQPTATIITQQQQNDDSASHPLWKMQLVGATPPRKPYVLHFINYFVYIILFVLELMILLFLW